MREKQNKTVISSYTNLRFDQIKKYDNEWIQWIQTYNVCIVWIQWIQWIQTIQKYNEYKQWIQTYIFD